MTVAGAILLIAGLIMLLTPGPGLAGIILGLAILGTEYAWAKRALEQAKKRARQAAQKVRHRRRHRGG